VHTFDRTTAALVAALIGDPFYRAITAVCGEDVDSRSAILSDYFEYSLAEAHRTGRCIVHENPTQGAAAWLLPRTPDTDRAERAAKAAHLAALLDAEGWRNYRRIVGFMSKRSARLIPAGAWYLTIIGVHPEGQGRGVGAQLLRPTLQEASERGAHAFLETFSGRTVRFYERAGFTRIAEFVEPVTAAPYVLMHRAP
jgi:ribosomal protein S18 acetylase RimI-like enzyme